MITDSTGDVVRACRRSPPSEAQSALANGTQAVERYKAKLDPVLRFSGSPYAAPRAPAPRSEGRASLEPAPRSAQPARPPPAGGSQDLNQYGAASHAQLRDRDGRSDVAGRGRSRGRSGTLRTVQVGGMVAAVLLLGAIFFYFARNLRKDEAVSNRQRKETATFCAR